MIHGGAGLDAHARKQASRLAAFGFAAFACDLYGASVAGDRARIMAALNALRADAPRLCRRVRAGLSTLLRSPECDGRAVAVGYCFGGLAALELARSGEPLAGVVSVHGSLATARPAERGGLRARALVCHGALDPHVPLEQVRAFMEEMNRAEADWQLLVLGGAEHGFTHEGGPPMPGVAFHAASDARAWAAMERFFRELFGGLRAPDGR